MVLDKKYQRDTQVLNTKHTYTIRKAFIHFVDIKTKEGDFILLAYIS